MKARLTDIRRPLVIVAVLILGLGLATIRICADGGGMAAAYQTCECRGLEWELYDKTEADGPRRTLCFGWVQSWTCFEFREGRPVACSEG